MRHTSFWGQYCIMKAVNVVRIRALQVRKNNKLIKLINLTILLNVMLVISVTFDSVYVDVIPLQNLQRFCKYLLLL